MPSDTLRTAFTSLPIEIILGVCRDLDSQALCRLAQTCKALFSLMDNFAWKDHILCNPRPSVTSRCNDLPRQVARYNHLTDLAWSRRSFISRAICEPWPRMRPVMALSPSTLVVGAGDQIVFFDVVPPGSSTQRQLREPVYHRVHARDSRRDITGLVSLPDGGKDRLFCVARADGLVQRMQLSESGTTFSPSARFDHPASAILALTSRGDAIVSASRNGLISFFAGRSPWKPPTTFTIGAKPWSLYLNPSRTFLAVGTVGVHPLNLYPVAESGPVSTPFASLRGTERSSAVYDITHAAEGSIYGSSSTSVLVSAWYDGATRLHDVRQKSRLACLTLNDPWDDSPVYSVAAGGGSSCHIASGSSYHGIVRIFDVRQPTQGWSAFSPGKDASPVYSMAMESSRLFGVTEARAFVMDFDPSVAPADYPSTPMAARAAARRGDTSLNGEWTPFYAHGLAKIDASKRPARIRSQLASPRVRNP